MDMDAVLLARIQFAFTITFHIIFPSFSIGLAAFIATLLVRWRMTGKEHFRKLARFWTKIFAVSFAMGVVSGIVLSYQFGTNWAGFSVVAGNIVGPLMGYEVLMAFFLEATFLGIMLFGWERVSPNLHVLSAILVALGTSMSAFWILAANSWMQTPDGFEMRNGVAYPVSWFHIIFNPSFPYRFAHMFTAAYLTTSVVVLAVGARYLVTSRFIEESKTMIRMGLGMVAVLAPLQLFIGDQHGLNTAKYQPVKLAAMEAHWDGSKPAELVLFAWPDAKAETNHFEVGIPHLGSLIITHNPDGLFKGLKDFKPDERPALLPIFFAFRAMVGIGLLLIAIGLTGAYLWWRGKLFEATWYLKPLTYAWPLGFIAIISGWWVTETGRQPYLVYGILKTVDAVSPVSFGAVLTTLILFVLIYTSVFSMGILYINRLIEKGPQGEAIAASGDPSLGAHPLTAAQSATRSALGSEE
jgi:cytochrome d ubiquinol oxidase subunit I